MTSPELTTEPTDIDRDELDELLGVLADATRRAIVTEVATNGRTTVDELGAGLVRGVGDDRSKAVELVHCHLPKLAAVDAVSYDAAEGTVAPAENTEFVVSLLAVARRSDS